MLISEETLDKISGETQKLLREIDLPRRRKLDSFGVVLGEEIGVVVAPATRFEGWNSFGPSSHYSQIHVIYQGQKKCKELGMRRTKAGKPNRQYEVKDVTDIGLKEREDKVQINMTIVNGSEHQNLDINFTFDKPETVEE